MAPGCRLAPETGQSPSQPRFLDDVLGGGAGANFWRGSSHGPGEDAGRSMCLCQGGIDVLEEDLGGDPCYALGGFDEVVAGAAGLFAAESVGKNEGFGELPSAHQEAGAINGPLACKIHSVFYPRAGPMFRFWFHRARSPPSGWSLQWSDCTRPNRPGQYHKNCAMVEFQIAEGMR